MIPLAFFELLMTIALQMVPALAAPPPSQGLLPSSADYPASSFIEDFGFVEFESSRPGFRAPLAFQVTVNGTRLSSAKAVFHERMVARLPHNQPIEVVELPAGEVWRFPVGTMVAHEIRFNDKSATLFEMRVVEKLDEKNWGYGTYVQTNDRLLLRTTPTSETKEFQLTDTDGKPLSIRLRTIPQASCARCHAQTSIGPEPQQLAEETGPCEFHPGNVNLRTSWASAFTALRGWAPFRVK
jgi:hypothetical protein